MRVRARILLALLAAPLAGACSAGPEPGLEVEAPAGARVFDLCELRVRFAGALRALGRFPDTQVHDAYDADRDGRYLRLRAEFRHEDGGTVRVPGFAMREKPGAPWSWRVRWAPRRAGRWTATVFLEGRAAAGGAVVTGRRILDEAIAVRFAEGTPGPLVAPGEGQNPRYLRRLAADGSSEAIWLFGACRAWVVRSQDPNNDWAPHEWLDRETELLAPMRGAGFNLLNQWMAPWEFLLVHRDRAEFWREGGANGAWKRHPIPEGAAWTAYQAFDQGRARAFDEFVRGCEGGPGKPTVRLLLSPLPHQCFQVKEHPWGSQESGWSPENDAGKQTLERLNGFSAFRKDMSVWEFFEADPAGPLAGARAQLFDHQANFFRYLVARWGYSRAIGAWVLVDELDGVGDVVGVMAERTGWWGHPACDRWLANVVRLFRGKLVRSDGLRYAGDPYRHPLHAATTSYGGEAGRGGNLDWTGGPEGVRPDLFGWHWYPYWPRGAGWSEVWDHTVAGVASYATAPIGDRPRLVSEFGAPDRARPSDAPSKIYPTLYHHAIWSAILSGHAGTPMDWDDGKEFGELAPRGRKGIFDRERYPIDHTAELRALRRFLSGLVPDRLAPCAGEGARVKCVALGKARVFALHATEGPEAVCGWVFASGEAARFSLRGLAPGEYRLDWHDPWTGGPVPGGKGEIVTVGREGAIELDAAPVLAQLARAAEAFPERSRRCRGQDAAFKLARRPTE